ncbi:MAG: ABC transporter permease [Actinomycetota bacterium]
MAKSGQRRATKAKGQARARSRPTTPKKPAGPAKQPSPAPPRRAMRPAGTIHLSGAYSIWQRELIRFFRERARAVTSFVQPLLYLLVFGSGLATVVDQSAIAGVNFRVFLLPGVIVMTTLFTSMFSGMSIVWDREFGFLKEILVSPVSRPAVIAGKVAGGATTAAMQGLAILIFSPIIGLDLSIVNSLKVVPALIVFAVAVNLLGVAIASRTQTMQAFFVIQNFVMLPMLFLSGSIYPLRGAPVWLRVGAAFDPATYAVDAIRASLLPVYSHVRLGSGFQLNYALDIGIIAALAVGLFVFAVRGINRQP